VFIFDLFLSVNTNDISQINIKYKIR